MMESARLRNNQNQGQAPKKLYPNFGMLGKRSVVQFNEESSENDGYCEVTVSKVIQSFQDHRNPIAAETRHNLKLKMKAANSPAVIGRFADDTSSQQSTRVRNNYFAEKSVCSVETDNPIEENLVGIDLGSCGQQASDEPKPELIKFDISQL